MSRQYKYGDRVPTDVLVKRLDELAMAVTKGQKGMDEFYMRIPAELDHDADLVMSECAMRLEKYEKVLRGMIGPCQGSNRKKLGACDCDPCVANEALGGESESKKLNDGKPRLPILSTTGGGVT